MRSFPRISFKRPDLQWIAAPLSRGYWRLSLLVAGGRWSTQLPAKARRSLRWLVLNGILANISNSIINTYQAVYLLTLGATPADIGLLSALANLTMPLAMLPGGRLARRARQYKWLVAIPALVARLSLLGLILLPCLSSQVRVIVAIAIGVVVARTFLMNLVNPAWTTMLGTIVPLRWRGRYFSTRNILLGGAGFLALLAVGQVIDRLASPQGYQVTLGIALAAGLGGVYALTRVEEPRRTLPPRAKGQTLHLRQMLRGQGRFLAFCGTAALWNFSVQIAGPFFIIFLSDEVGASASLLALSSATSVLAALPAQRVFGVLNDRKGARWVQRLTGFIIPLVPGVWGFMRQPWQAFPVQLISGFAWAGYNLAAFNLLLEMTPDEDRPTFVAVYQALVGLGMAGGAALGSWLIKTQGYQPVFLVSAIGRLAAAVLFSWVIVRGLPVRWPRLSHPRFRVPKLKIPGKGKQNHDQTEGGTTSISREDQTRSTGAGTGRAIQPGRDARAVDTRRTGPDSSPDPEPQSGAEGPDDGGDAAHHPL